MGGASRLGSQVAFDAVALDAAYRHRLRTYVRKFTCCEADADDVAQIVLARAASCSVRFDSRVDLEKWLFRVARNAAIDTRRREAVRARAAQLYRESATAVASENAPVAISGELRTAFSTLSPAQRQAIFLRFAAGLSTQQIATALCRRPDAVRHLIARGLKRLRAALLSPVLALVVLAPAETQDMGTIVAQIGAVA
jgi:RNA polymerase sigma-70 factor (ECF subfamily)